MHDDGTEGIWLPHNYEGKFRMWDGTEISLPEDWDYYNDNF